jgi:hypothetical protein
MRLVRLAVFGALVLASFPALAGYGIATGGPDPGPAAGFRIKAAGPTQRSAVTSYPKDNAADFPVTAARVEPLDVRLTGFDGKPMQWTGTNNLELRYWVPRALVDLPAVFQPFYGVHFTPIANAALIARIGQTTAGWNKTKGAARIIVTLARSAADADIFFVGVDQAFFRSAATIDQVFFALNTGGHNVAWSTVAMGPQQTSPGSFPVGSEYLASEQHEFDHYALLFADADPTLWVRDPGHPDNTDALVTTWSQVGLYDHQSDHSTLIGPATWGDGDLWAVLQAGHNPKYPAY